MDLNQPDIEQFEQLEDEIRSSFSLIVSNKTDFTARFYKDPSGGTINIFAPPMYAGKREYFLTPDRIAHQLSWHRDAIPDDFFKAVEKIILVPGFIAGAGSVLTHLYLPCEKILAFYLYPSRFHIDESIEIENRITGHYEKKQGLFFNVIRAVSQLMHYNTEKETMHKFLFPLHQLENEEITDLSETSDFFRSVSAGIEK